MQLFEDSAYGLNPSLLDRVLRGREWIPFFFLLRVSSSHDAEGMTGTASSSKRTATAAFADPNANNKQRQEKEEVRLLMTRRRRRRRLLTTRRRSRMLMTSRTMTYLRPPRR